MISFSKIHITGKETEYINDAIYRRHISGDGYYTKRVSQFMEEKFVINKALMTTSCTSALEMAAMLLDLKSGDEVIMPSYTFVSTANAIALRGAKPVFVDICEDTLNINPKEVETKVNKNTKVIFPVHYAGVSCDMDSIMKIGNQANIKVVEDAAQGVNATYKGKYLGTIGDIGCYSFHETKNYSCGEGGAILINKDKKLQDRAEIIREKGTNRSKFFRGEIDKYTWVDIGSSYLPSEINAAFLFAQFQRLDYIQSKREALYNCYLDGLKHLESLGKIRLPVIPKDCGSNYHIFYILLNSEKERDKLMTELRERNIYSVFHYMPLHLSDMGKKYGYRQGDLKITEDTSSRILRLPLYVDLSLEEVRFIISNIYDVMRK